MHMLKVAVAGASGYAGGEVLRWLLQHPEVEIGAVTAGGNAGARLGSIHPHLSPLADRVLEETTADDPVRPRRCRAGASARTLGRAWPRRLPDDVVVIDCGADFRLRSESAWTTFYDTPYAGSWAYGLPELALPGGGRGRDGLEGAHRIAVPGCYPTAVSLALAPGLAAGVLEPDDVVVVAASGTSGAGKSLKPHLLGSEVMGVDVALWRRRRASPHPRDRAEPRRCRGRPGDGRPSPRPWRPWPGASSPHARPRSLRECPPRTCGTPGHAAYARSPSSTSSSRGSWPATAHVLGSNHVHRPGRARRAGRTRRRVAAIDNLDQGHGRCRRPVPQPRLGLPSRPAFRIGGGAVSAMPLHLMTHPESLAIARLEPGEEPDLGLDRRSVRLAQPTPTARPSIVCAGRLGARGREDRGPVPRCRGGRTARFDAGRRHGRDLSTPLVAGRHQRARPLHLRHRLDPGGPEREIDRRLRRSGATARPHRHAQHRLTGRSGA